MARQRELLSLVSIAEETGISYATLRNYTLKYAEEIPSEGSGRNTRYPRSAVKVFQRLRKESKPGRKPASASAPAPVIEAPSIEVAPAITAPLPIPREAPQPAPRQAATDTSGLERELAAIRGFLGSIANSLEQLASKPKSSAPAPVPVAVEAEKRPEASAPIAQERVGVPLPVREMLEVQEPGGHRRLHSLPKVMGQRGKRPE